MSRYLRWSRSEHRESTRIAVLLLVGPVFLSLLPALVAGAGPRLDRRLGRRPLRTRTSARILGGSLAVAGFTLGVWSVQAQLDRGRGTPLPMMPTQELLTDGPFRYCRNPMTLGAILAYLGIAVAARTTAGIAIVLAFGASVLAYLKCLEEPELAERFGESYLRYRRATPFMIPRLSRPSSNRGRRGERPWRDLACRSATRDPQEAVAAVTTDRSHVGGGGYGSSSRAVRAMPSGGPNGRANPIQNANSKGRSR